MKNRSPFTMKEVGVSILKKLSESRAEDKKFAIEYKRPFKKDVFTRIRLKEELNLDLINDKQIESLMWFLAEALKSAGYAQSELTIKLSGLSQGGGRTPQINGIFYNKLKSFAVFEVEFSSNEFDIIGDIKFAEIESAFTRLIDQFPDKQLMMHASQNNQVTTEKHYEYKEDGIRKTISPEDLKELERRTSSLKPN